MRIKNSNFVDYVKIFCRSGKGGAGSSHFRRDKITAKIAVNNSAAIPDNNILDVADFNVEDLTGNVLTITTLDIAQR